MKTETIPRTRSDRIRAHLRRHPVQRDLVKAALAILPGYVLAFGLLVFLFLPEASPLHLVLR